MAKPDARTDRRAAGRETLAWFSAAAFLMVFLSYGSIGAYRGFVELTGFDMQRPVQLWELPLLLAGCLIVLGVLVYLSLVAWLLFAKLFFTRAEVSKVVFYGPTTRLERWLVDVLFPNDESTKKAI